VIKRLLPIVVALGFALVAAGMAKVWLEQQRAALQKQYEERAAQYGKPVDVIVASRNLPEQHVLAPEDLALLAVPEKLVQPTATSRPEQLLGMATLAPLARGEQVQRNKVVPPEQVAKGPKTVASKLSDVTPSGKRAVTIEADPITGVGGFVRPGDRVDLLWTFDIRGAAAAGRGNEPVTMSLFQDVEVLAVDTQMLGQAAPDAAQAAGAAAPAAPRSKFTVTLALTPQETALLLYARTQGLVQMSLRAEDDEGRRVAVIPADKSSLMKAVYGEDVTAVPQAASPHAVEVFKGLERDVVSVQE